MSREPSGLQLEVVTLDFYMLYMNKYTVLCIPRPVKRVEAQEHYEDTDYLRNHKGITFRFIMMMMLVLPSGHLSGIGIFQGSKVMLMIMIVIVTYHCTSVSSVNHCRPG